MHWGTQVPLGRTKMPLALIPVLIQLGMQILGWIINKKLNDDKLKKAFADFSELARTENIKTIIKRQNAESQIGAGNAKWDDEEKGDKK